jgi:hypothetical protein
MPRTSSASTSPRRSHRPTPRPSTISDAERAALAALEPAAAWDSGYSTQHDTRPQTIGYGRVDSPAGLCAWIIEKFWARTDHGGHLDGAERRFVDIRYWSEPDRGEHVAAFEQPQLFVEETRAFFRLVRQPA